MLTIVPATAADASDILALQKRAYESEARLYNDWSIPPLLQTLDSLIADINQMTVLKAVEDGRIVGSVRSDLRDGVCQVGRLIVELECQRRGTGTALLQAVEKASPKARRFELFTGNLSAGNIRLYQRLGYEITGTRRLSDKVSLVFMAKQVRPGV
jgi:predicted N-acetyltransferase YhbS